MNRTGETWGDLLNCMEELNRDGLVGEQFSQKVDELPRLADNLALYDDVPTDKQALVHYTSWERAISILRQSDPIMRMYHYELANDPEEGRILPMPWKAVYEEATAWIQEWQKRHDVEVEGSIEGGDAYGCSFSSSAAPSGEAYGVQDTDNVEDKLTFWRFYGNDGEGCSFKVSRSIFFSPEYHGIYRVRYKHSNGDAIRGDDSGEAEDREIASRMRKLLDSTKSFVEGSTESDNIRACKVAIESLCRVFGGYRHLIKNVRYSDEREWRMIKVMPPQVKINFDPDHGNIVRRYVDGLRWRDLLSSRSVVTVGPRVRNRAAAVAYVEHLVGDKFSDSAVRSSEQTYRRSDR